MKSNLSSQTSSKKKIYILIFLLFLIFCLYLLFSLKINKFLYKGDTDFLDMSDIKIISLNLLKDQPLFFYNKAEFEKAIKESNKQITTADIKIVNQDTVEITLRLENFCCVVVDIDENKYLVDKNGEITKKIPSDKIYNNQIVLNQKVSLESKLNSENILKLKQLKTDLDENKIEVEKFLLDKDLINIILKNGITLIIDSNVVSSSLVNKYKNLNSYLEKNDKNYSIVDFRFEKVVVR